MRIATAPRSRCPGVKHLKSGAVVRDHSPTDTNNCGGSLGNSRLAAGASRADPSGILGDPTVVHIQLAGADAHAFGVAYEG